MTHHNIKMPACLRSQIASSNTRYTARRLRTSNCHKDAINHRLASLLSGHQHKGKRKSKRKSKTTRALVLDDESLGTSRILASVPRVVVTVPNPCSSGFNRFNIPRCVRLRDCTVQAFLARHRGTFQLLYLDFCGTFSSCFEAVETGALHLACQGTLAYTFCNRGVPRAQIAFDALRSRELAQATRLTLDSCVAYRDMVTVVLTRSAGTVGPKIHSKSHESQDVKGHFRVQCLTRWRVQRILKQQVLQFRVKWVVGGESWEPAEALVADLDRATFVRLVHEM